MPMAVGTLLYLSLELNREILKPVVFVHKAELMAWPGMNDFRTHYAF